MARIFSVLALLAVLLLAANFVVGLSIGDFNAAAQRRAETASRYAALRALAKRGQPSPQLDEAKQLLIEADAALQGPKFYKDIHMLLGVAAALVTVLVNSITITYFIGTSRWCKEVCQTYSIASDLAEKSTRLKRSTFPWALAGIVAVIAIVVLGAAADPSGANFARSSSFVFLHY